MPYNLTDSQKELAKQIVLAVREKRLTEPFRIHAQSFALSNGAYAQKMPSVSDASLRSLEKADLIVCGDGSYDTTPKLFSAVDSNFSDNAVVVPISTLAQSHPPEIAMSLDRLRVRYPDPKKLGFLIMRFAAAKPFEAIVEAIKKTAAKHDLEIVRADENDFHADLLGNVRTYLHGCGFGIAVYERIDTNEPNANVGLEVGYLMAMNKPVLLLKDKTVQTLQSDLAGRLYKPFDPHNPEGTIPAQLEKWLADNGIIVPKSK